MYRIQSRNSSILNLYACSDCFFKFSSVCHPRQSMEVWSIQLYNKWLAYRAKLKKSSLSMTADGSIAFSYFERKIQQSVRPTLVFIHGFSSNKETWLSIISIIPEEYHCLAIDLPRHGETIGFDEEFYAIDQFVDSLKQFFDRKKLHGPLCLIGASLGGAIILMFALKYPDYVNKICLLASPADRNSETEIIEQLRNGYYTSLLPETIDQLMMMIEKLTVKKPRISRWLLGGYLKLRLSFLANHKKLMDSLLENEYPKLEKYYLNLKNLEKPVLILWGRQDQLYSVEGADYFHRLIPGSKKVILEDCGHFMGIDKPEETCAEILNFSN